MEDSALLVKKWASEAVSTFSNGYTTYSNRAQSALDLEPPGIGTKIYYKINDILNYFCDYILTSCELISAYKILQFVTSLLHSSHP